MPSLEISAGPPPVFRWTTGCGAASFAVYDLRSGFALWHLEPQSRRLLPPLTYGVVPAGVREVHPPEALQSGTQYGVYLKWVVGTDTLDGNFPFTP
jgi:hypothetical protein